MFRGSRAFLRMVDQPLGHRKQQKPRESNEPLGKCLELQSTITHSFSMLFLRAQMQHCFAVVLLCSSNTCFKMGACGKNLVGGRGLRAHYQKAKTPR